MKKILTLALALVLAFTANSFAEEADSSTNMKKERSERMHTKANKGERSEMRGENKAKQKGKMTEERKKARKQCVQKCGLDKEKIRACRKQHGAEKGERLDGKCLSEKKKSCIKTCMKSKKSAHKKSMKNDRKKGERKNKRNHKAEMETESAE